MHLSSIVSASIPAFLFDILCWNEHSLKSEDVSVYCRQALCAARLRPKLKDTHVMEVRYDKLCIRTPDSCSREQIISVLQAMMAAIPKVVVSGIPTIARAVVQAEDSKDGSGKRYSLVVEGVNYRCVLNLVLEFRVNAAG